MSGTSRWKPRLNSSAQMALEVTVVLVDPVETHVEKAEGVVREGKDHLMEEKEETVQRVGMAELMAGEEEVEVLAVWEATMKVKEVAVVKEEGVGLLAELVGVVALVVKEALVAELEERQEMVVVVVAPQFVTRATSLAQSPALVDQEGLVGPVGYVQMEPVEREEPGVMGVLANCIRRVVGVDLVGTAILRDGTVVTDRTVSQDD